MALIECFYSMNLSQLRYLVLLAEELNFTRAAARAHVAQPALSRQVRNLEDELGVPLVDRTTRRVQLTPAGAEIVARARLILEELDALRSYAEDAADLLTGRVAIGLTPTTGPFDAASTLADFHARYPGIELALTEELSVSLAGRLRRDEIDLAFISAIPDRMLSRNFSYLPLIDGGYFGEGLPNRAVVCSEDRDAQKWQLNYVASPTDIVGDTPDPDTGASAAFHKFLAFWST